ncbi:MAG: hypothetical protein IJU25_02175 [Lachnospiraceae bacterium]|nr:hypothetical protein [Lachnospiraceae bacterium]
MKKTVILYDDSRIPERMIRNITGNKSFGETIYKRKTLRERTAQIITKLEHCAAFLDVSEAGHGSYAGNAVLKLYSDMAIRDVKAFDILTEKALYAKECFKVVQDEKTAAVIYPDMDAFLSANPDREEECLAIATDAFLNLASPAAFRQFITGGFDARFFNELKGDAYTVIKQSTNVEKLRREYTFYSLLPDDMKMWFAMPFSYREENGTAAYTMERYHMTDLAIRYVHGAISPEEFRQVMEKLFRFIECRHTKTVDPDTYSACMRKLYVEKVAKRLDELQKSEAFERLNDLLKNGTGYDGLAAVYEKYLQLYEHMTAKRRFEPVLVIGHGDLCFSNILYSDEASFMKLIDPKGAETEEELYTDPYYDLAKLSHSVCGAYDYFNSDLFEITLDDDMRLKLHVDCDNAVYEAIFKEYLEKHRLDYDLIRLYETSLFLSMLPLHIDREKKVMGFLLNAISIMEGIANE